MIFLLGIRNIFIFLDILDNFNWSFLMLFKTPVVYKKIIKIESRNN